MKQKLTFKNSKGQKLVGILSNPTDDKSKPIIILCHGLNSHKGRSFYCELEEELNKKKISTFKFDFHSHGESEGRVEDITFSQGVDDTLNAIQFLKKLGYTKIGLQGTSFGGLVSIMTASKTNDLFVLALKCPVSNYEETFGVGLPNKSKKDLEEWKNKGFRERVNSEGVNCRLNYNFIIDSRKNNGYEAAKKIDIPTLIVHGGADELVPVEQSEKTAGLIKNCRLEIIKGASHNFSNPGETEKVVGAVVDFIVNHSS